MRVPPVPYPAKACVTRARSVAWLARAGREPAPQGLRLLFYHRVADDDDELAVPVRRFREQMDFLAGEGYRVVDVVELGSLLAEGHASAPHGRPELRRRLPRRGGERTAGARAARLPGDRLRHDRRHRRTRPLHVVRTPTAAAHLGGGRRSGPRRHADVRGAFASRIPTCLAVADEQAAYEIAESRVELERRLGRRVTAFSYPTGLFGEREMRLVERGGLRRRSVVRARRQRPDDESLRSPSATDRPTRHACSTSARKSRAGTTRPCRCGPSTAACATATGRGSPLAASARR